MEAAALEVGGLEIQVAELAEAVGADVGEFVEELVEGFALTLADVSLAVEGGKGVGVAGVEDDPGAGDPVGSVAVDEMADDVEGGPGVGAFVVHGPFGGEIAQERVECGGGAGEQGDGLFEGLLHDAPRIL